MPFNPKKMLSTIGANVAEARRARGWSQQELADRSKVSVRMISLIESGENNVSLATLGNLAGALELTFTQLLEDARELPGPAAMLPRKGIRLWQGSRRGTKVRLLQSMACKRTMELWSWTIAPGDRYQGEADLPGFREVVYVIRGELTLEQEGANQVLRAGDSIAFPSDQAYAFTNTGDCSLIFTLNVVG